MKKEHEVSIVWKIKIRHILLGMEIQEIRIKPGLKLHFVGVGGIGMSGLAQMLKSAGGDISGSDRGLDQPENRRILEPLRAQGVRLYPQDGSYIKDSVPDALVYSTAIEEDNPDFKSAGGVPRIHRSKMLSSAMLQCGFGEMTAVAGSCGKTTVTSWLAETMFMMGLDPSFLTGGLANRFISDASAGNFYRGSGGHFVFEADESDKSLVAYSPEYALILNIGTDHYSKEEIIEVFRSFLKNVKKGVVMDEKVHELLGPDSVKGLDLRLFSSDPDSGSAADWRLTGYSASFEKVSAQINDSIEIALPTPGIHSAANATAVLAALDLMGCDPKDAVGAVSQFKGVWRRFDYAGQTENGAKVYDDYAHNVEKIVSCISAAGEIAGGRLIALFQPHGYGPLGFMKDELLRALEKTLSDNDVFAMLPVYYAGGTSSFKPASEEVISEYKRKGAKNYKYFDSRKEAQDFIQSSSSQEDVVLIMGARDNSLSDWSEKIIANRTCEN